MMTSSNSPKGDVGGFRAFVRKVLAYEPPPKVPKPIAEPKGKYRRSVKKRRSNVAISS